MNSLKALIHSHQAKSLIFSFYCFVCFGSFVTAEDSGKPIAEFEYALAFGGKGGEEGLGITVDLEGNTFSTGYFEGTVDFDAGEEQTELTCHAESDMYVTKHDPSGNLLWARQLNGSLESIGQSLITDSLGNVYIAGNFRGTVDFDPGPEKFLLSSEQGTQSESAIDYGFILKLDPDGNFIWANSITVTGDMDIFNILLDQNENIILGGTFSGQADFDPGPGVHQLTSQARKNSFIMKLDENGSFYWVNQYGGLAETNLQGLGVSDSGDIYAAGKFTGQAKFAEDYRDAELTNDGTCNNAYLLKVDESGNFNWVKQLGGSSRIRCFALAVDAAGDVCVTGYFQDANSNSFVSNNNHPPLISNGRRDVFIIKFDRLGNNLWLKQFGSEHVDVAFAICFDKNSNVYTTGRYRLKCDFDPGTDQGIIESEDNADIFILKLNRSGEFAWVRSLNGPKSNSGFGIAVDEQDHVYVTGSFDATATVNSPTASFQLPHRGDADSFLLKLRQNPK